MAIVSIEWPMCNLVSRVNSRLLLLISTHQQLATLNLFLTFLVINDFQGHPAIVDAHPVVLADIVEFSCFHIHLDPIVGQA